MAQPAVIRHPDQPTLVTAGPGEWATVTFAIRNLGLEPDSYSYEPYVYSIRGGESKGQDLTAQWQAFETIQVNQSLGLGQVVQASSGTGVIHPAGGNPYLPLVFRVRVPADAGLVGTKFLLGLRAVSRLDSTEVCEAYIVLMVTEGAAASIRLYAGRLKTEMEDTWQRLPVSIQLPEPVPLKVALACHKAALVPVAADIHTGLSLGKAIEQALAASSVVVVLGNAGAGKTASLKWVVREQAIRLLRCDADTTAKVPVYVDLGNFRDCASLETILTKARPEGVTTKHSVCWFLDSLDLLSDKCTPTTVLRDVKERAATEDQFVLSARPTSEIEGSLDKWGRSWRISLLPMDGSARRLWIDKHAKGAWPSLAKWEATNPAARQFLDTPLFFAMVLSSCLNPSHSLPMNCDVYPGRTGIIRAFVHCAMECAVRDGRIANLERQNLDHATIAGFWWSVVTSGDVDRFFQEQEAYHGSRAFVDWTARRWPESRDILVRTGLLFYMPSEDVYCVPHQLIAEYWAARHVESKLLEAEATNRFEDEVLAQTDDLRPNMMIPCAFAILSSRPNGATLLRRALDAMANVDALSAFWITGKVGGPDARDFLVGKLKDANDKTRVAAMCAMLALADPEVLPDIVRGLADADRGVRTGAVLALMKLRDPRGFEPLCHALASDDCLVRANAAEALGEFGDIRAVALLQPLVADDNFLVAKEAAEAISKLQEHMDGTKSS